MDDYIKYWGMEKPPFSLTPDPDMLYLSNQHAECLMRLKYAIFSQKGGALLVSDTAGNGKTSLLSRLKKDLDVYYAGRAKIVFIDHPTVSPIEMIGEIAHQLGAELHTTEKIRALNHLRDRLFSLYNENIKVVVIVDEGQMLKDRPDLLGELRILLNFCVSESFLLTFIFSGQKPLDMVLREMPEFWQRLPVRFFLKNLDFNDTKSLILYRLEKAGLKNEIFTDDAFEGIYNYSGGCPRVICSVADLCLIVGFAKGVRKIGFVEVSTACRDMESSGDGFHYYAYIKSQEPRDSKEIKPKNRKKTVTISPTPDSEISETNKFRKIITVSDGVICMSCTHNNPSTQKFCEKCNRPLYSKCPKCFFLTDTISDICPSCGSNLTEEKEILMERASKSFKIVNSIGDNGKLWCQANEIHVDNKEKIVSVLPKGNFLSDGPILKHTESGVRTKEECDIVITDKRILIKTDEENLTLEIINIDSCIISEKRNMLKKVFSLMLSSDGTVYLLDFPYGTRKSKTVAETLSAYIKSLSIY